MKERKKERKEGRKERKNEQRKKKQKERKEGKKERTKERKERTKERKNERQREREGEREGGREGRREGRRERLRASVHQWAMHHNNSPLVTVSFEMPAAALCGATGKTSNGCPRSCRNVCSPQERDEGGGHNTDFQRHSYVAAVLELSIVVNQHMLQRFVLLMRPLPLCLVKLSKWGTGYATTF